jgi:CubicO group peptidase (beta-lactamase class C family)
MLPWSEVIDPVADQNGFAGVVSVHRGGETEFARAYGLADRARQIPNTVRTRFAIASGTKGLTALAVVSLINDNALAMSTTARSVLGTDLPLIGDDVTIEHLLAHRSGIGDYLDEEAGYDITGYPLTVPPKTWPPPGSTWQCSAGTPPSSPLASGSPIATAGMSCSR